MPATTSNMALPYPVGSDPVSGVRQDIGNLAEYTDGAVGGAWADYTPTLTNLTLGNGTLVARYKKIGRTVHLYLYLVYGSTSSGSANWSFGLPVTPLNARCVGSSIARQGSNVWACVSMHSSSLVYSKLGGGASTNVGSTVPFTWASGNELVIEMTYESAT